MHATGDYVATASYDKTWGLYDISNGVCLTRVPDQSPTGAFRCCSFHPDGLIMATGTADAMVRVWDIKNQSLAATFKGHKRAVTAVSFSENGCALSSCQVDVS